MRAQDDTPVAIGAAVVAVPASDVADRIGLHVLQSDVIKQLGDARAACALGTRGCRDRGQRRLTGERHFVEALDVRARGAYAFVREQGINGVRHGQQTTGAQGRRNSAGGAGGALDLD